MQKVKASPPQRTRTRECASCWTVRTTKSAASLTQGGGGGGGVNNVKMQRSLLIGEVKRFIFKGMFDKVTRKIWAYHFLVFNSEIERHFHTTFAPCCAAEQWRHKTHFSFTVFSHFAFTSKQFIKRKWEGYIKTGACRTGNRNLEC